MQGIYAVVYEPTHKIVYVGQAVNIHRRWTHHKSDARSPQSGSYNYPLYRAMRKYGQDNYSCGLIEEVADARLLTKKEKYYYDVLGGRDKLYNILDPLLGPAHYVGYNIYQIDAGTLEIVAEYKSVSEASRVINCRSTSLDKLLLGQGYKVKGYHWCLVDDWYAGWKPIKKHNARQAKPVQQMDLNGNVVAVYPSLTQIEKQTNRKFKKESVFKACRGIQPTAYGYKWAFKEE